MIQLTMNELTQGDKAKIINFIGGYGTIKKLNAMGVRTGKKVTLISKSFIGGPVTIQIDNSKISIGQGMASKIVVEVEK
ncbi:MAG: FeoA family protein [Halanaerobiales bacterium]